jgi:nucleotide-binding universal stress UspA family protein
LHVLATNVQTRPVTIWPEATIDVRSVEEALLANGREIAERAISRLRASGLNAEAAVRLGFPAEALLREAESRGAELLVMGTRGHGVLGGFAIGSVALRVAHGSRIPVCLVRGESKLPSKLGIAMRTLLAVDGSEAALRAAGALASWRSWLGELDVQIVYVQQPLTYLETVLPPHDDVIQQWSTRAGEDATRAVSELLAKEGVRSHLHLTIGDPAREIAHLAEDTGCELLVMGTRGMGAAHHALVGSVALKVAAQAAMPVVLVK